MKKSLVMLVVYSCFACMGNPIRSAVGARQSSFLNESDKEYSPCDYVQGGLISIWDGEWNGGVGVHDSQSQIWKNLIDDGTDIPTILPSLAWGDKYLERNGVDGISFLSGIDLSDPISPRTLEIVISANELPLSPSSECYFFRAYDVGIRITYRTDNQIYATLRADAGTYGIGLYGPNIGINTISLVGTDIPYVLNPNDRRYRYIYVNGEAISKNGMFGGNPSANPGFELFSASRRDWPEANVIRIFCIRFYNRALAEEEIIHNHKVDAARFGL